MSQSSLERPLLPWRRLPFPIDWGAEFGALGPLHVEIGFGDGRYTVRRAQAAPAERFVGLEISSGSLQRALRRVRGGGVSNVRLAKTGARFALRHLFPARSLLSIVVNFPDPWPKERHVRHRLLQRGFFDLAASRLVVGGSVRLATDHPDYLAFALDEAGASGWFEARRGPPPAAVLETKYALKWRAEGKPLHYVEFVYGGRSTPSFPILERPETMPHSLFRGALPPEAPFRKVVERYGDGHVILHEVARSFGAEHTEDGARWWVRATVDEPDIKQQMLVLVHQRTTDEVIVRLESFGDPIVTTTCRGAVHAVTEWLAAVTGLEVRQRNY